MKTWKASWTLWFNNSITAIMLVLLALETVMPTVAMYLPGPHYAYIVIAVTVINALLRYYRTSQPIQRNGLPKSD